MNYAINTVLMIDNHIAEYRDTILTNSGNDYEFLGVLKSGLIYCRKLDSMFTACLPVDKFANARIEEVEHITIHNVEHYQALKCIGMTTEEYDNYGNS